MRALLRQNLELARLQDGPAPPTIPAAELERLREAAPAHARELLATEGYFKPAVTLEADDAPAGGLPQLRLRVEPGSRATVDGVRIDVSGPLHDAAAAGDADARSEIAALIRDWPLRRGMVFSQAAWIAAKNSVLARVRADGHAAAHWARSRARVDAGAARADLDLVLHSGPVFRFGAIEVQGTGRYDDEVVRRVATFAAGDRYTEKLLSDYEDRLRKLGLFEGVVVTIDAEAAEPGAAPVHVRVKELPLQQLTLAVGISANTGAHASAEHFHRNVFGSRWIAKNTIVAGPEAQSWEVELNSHPREGNRRNLLAGRVGRLYADGQWRLAWGLRVGRAFDTLHAERTVFAEFARSRVDGEGLVTEAAAVSLNGNWVVRDLDSVLLPTEGRTTSIQATLGSGRGTRREPDGTVTGSRGPFARLYARRTWYEPFGSSWYGTARLEAGQVVSRNGIVVPDPLLFAAGGDESVRGYGYRTLGPTVDGVTTSGRSLLTASLEVARPLQPTRPAFWGAAFIDAGHAADRFAELRPVLGYGIGLRWRSAVGPLRLDVAYGHETEAWRMHFSVGIAL